MHSAGPITAATAALAALLGRQPACTCLQAAMAPTPPLAQVVGKTAHMLLPCQPGPCIPARNSGICQAPSSSAEPQHGARLDQDRPVCAAHTSRASTLMVWLLAMPQQQHALLPGTPGHASCTHLSSRTRSCPGLARACRSAAPPLCPRCSPHAV